MVTYRVGAPRTIRPQANGLGRSRQVPGGARRVAHPDYPCHAVDLGGDALCGFSGAFTTLDEPSWDEAATITRCVDCELAADAGR
jgi:hypothetical protein